MIASTSTTPPAELLRLKSQHIMPCVNHFYRNPPHLVAGSGSQLVDHEGKSYFDCLSGVGVMNAGHCQPEIIDPAIEQIRTLQHTSAILLTEPQIRLAEALSTIVPRSLIHAFFCASGSEAVEGAMMAARLHTQRPKILAFEGSLHGRTRWGMNATGLPMWRTDPFPDDSIIHVPFGDADALNSALARHDRQIAAVLGEPIQGNGGIIVPHDEWWPHVRRSCDEFGVLLILDEVQTGFNRTGRWFACEHWGIAPDLLATSKGLGNGFPIAAFLASESVAKSYARPSASTYGGNPVSAVAALQTIHFHQQHDLGRRATLLGRQLMTALRDISAVSPVRFEAPRGLGFMCGLPLRGADASDAARRCEAMLERLKDEGVLAGKAGRDRNVLTFMPPLVMTTAELAAVCQAVRHVATTLD